MTIKKILLSLSALASLGIGASAYAEPFTIVPDGALPTTVTEGGTVDAAYTVTSGMSVDRNGVFVKYLPPNVSIGSGGCGETFNLASEASCTLNLVISGAVDGNDPNPANHLFICTSDGTTCSGTRYPLNVTETSGPVVPVAQYPMLIPFPSITTDDNAAPYAIDSEGPLPEDFVSNGFFNAVSCGSSSCIAVGKYTASSSVVYPMIAKGDTSGANWSYVIDKTTGTLPADYSTGGSFNTVSCSGTTCVAGGRYVDTGTGAFLMMAVSTDSGTTWTYPINNTVPTWPASFANATANVANFTDVDCVDANRCVASGTYTASVPTTAAYPLVAITSNAGSTWSYVIEEGTGLPGDFDSAGAFNSVDCTGSGTTAVCAVGGTYNNGSSVYALLATSANTGSTWTYRVSSANPPTDYTNAGVINGVACSGATTTSTCAGVGSYTNGIAEQTMVFALGVNAGAGSPTWTFPVESGSLPPSTYNAQASFASVSCTGATTTTICIASGSYSAGGQPIPMVLYTPNNGTGFSYPVQNGTNEPSNTLTAGVFTDVSCTGSDASADCFVSGHYTDGGVQYPMVISTLDGGSNFTYNVKEGLNLPADFASNGNMGAVVCAPLCLTAGEYVNEAVFVNEENAWNYWLTEVNTLRTDYHPKLLAHVNVPLSPMASLGIAPLGNESSNDSLIGWLSRFFG